jgi:immune inhibitor A
VIQAGATFAMPPHPDLAQRVRAGEVAVPACDRDLAMGTPQPWAHHQRLRPASGTAVDTFRALAILVHYSDAVGATDPTVFDTLLYQVGTGSVRDFYRECSYGKLDLVTVDLPSATGWLGAPQTAAYYANGEYGLGGSSYPRNARRLVEDAVAAADASVDFSRYDNDGNGWVDVLMVVHSGPGAEFTGDTADVWSHKWSISPQLRDGVYLAPYTMMPEYWSAPGDITIGVFAHELGHGFGLPDLYDTDYSSRGVGRWSLMAGGAWNGILGSSPAHFDAWCKVQLGFVTPVTPTTSALGVHLPQVETDSVVYRLWDGGLVANEYFLVENRQRVGFDASLPAGGLLIWHIDDGVLSDNDQEWYPGHTSSGHYLVALEQADGLYQLEQNQNQGNGGDPYPGTTNARAFNSTTTPGSLGYSGVVSFVTVSNISDSDSLMTADFSVSLASGILEDVRPQSPVSARNYPNPFNAGTQIEVNSVRPGPVRVDVYDLLGARVWSHTSLQRAAGPWRILWDGRDETGRPLASGVYWYRVTMAGTEAHGRMVMIK